MGKQKEILKRLVTLDERLDKVELNRDNMEEYLNGHYHEWLAAKEIAKKAM